MYSSRVEWLLGKGILSFMSLSSSGIGGEYDLHTMYLSLLLFMRYSFCAFNCD